MVKVNRSRTVIGHVDVSMADVATVVNQLWEQQINSIDLGCDITISIFWDSSIIVVTEGTHTLTIQQFSERCALQPLDWQAIHPSEQVAETKDLLLNTP